MNDIEFQARCRGQKTGCSLTEDEKVEEFFRVCVLYLMLARLAQAQR